MYLYKNKTTYYCFYLLMFIVFPLKGELNKEEDRILVAKGGLGGKLHTNFLPLKGQKRIIHLDLKVIADVGLVG